MSHTHQTIQGDIDHIISEGLHDEADSADNFINRGLGSAATYAGPGAAHAQVNILQMIGQQGRFISGIG